MHADSTTETVVKQVEVEVKTVTLSLTEDEARKLRQIMGSNDQSVTEPLFSAYRSHLHFQSRAEVTHFMAHVYYAVLEQVPD